MAREERWSGVTEAMVMIVLERWRLILTTHGGSERNAQKVQELERLRKRLAR